MGVPVRIIKKLLKPHSVAHHSQHDRLIESFAATLDRVVGCKISFVFEGQMENF